MAGSQREPVASTPLLETKFYAPRWRPGSVARPRLLSLLNRGMQSKLTVVSAPAGFGKTALLAEWLASEEVRGRPLVWLSLDRSDSEPTAFWTYLVAAVQAVHPGFGAATLASLKSPQPAPVEALLGGLVNELAALGEDMIVVLEDYHLVEGGAVHDGVGFLLDHLPPPIHLVITGRADPPLSLARLRGRGELTEIRAADLRFTAEEATSFLNDAMGLSLSKVDIARLGSRAEGWIAGLQLAALSMQSRTDATEFIDAFTGNDRYIVDYLMEEVLERQPDEIREFLLDTSILERLSGPLCDAVTDTGGGATTLARLERGNLFLVPLDDRRQWYRYHHLFGDVLQAHLREARPEHVSTLHRRASGWFEEQGEFALAVRHALAARDFQLAAAQIELAARMLQRDRQEGTLRGWLEALPEEVLKQRPVLCAAYGGVLLTFGDVEAAERRIRDAASGIETAELIDRGSATVPASPGYVDARQFRSLPGWISVYRAGLEQVRGNLDAAAEHARSALELLPDDDELGHGAASALLGLALWGTGDLASAYGIYEAAMERVRTAGFVPDVLASTISLGEMRLGQGRLREAEATYGRALKYAAEQSATLGTADVHVAMSELCRERNEIELATQHLLTSRELGEGAALHEHRHRWFVAMAGVRQAVGDLDGALDLLAEAEAFDRDGFSPNVRPIGALRANLWVAQGRISDAATWAADAGLTAEDEPTYRREFEHLALVRVLVERARTEKNPGLLDDAQRLLGRLVAAAEAANRAGSVLHILALEGIVREALGDRDGALTSLERALAIGEPEGYVRSFVDGGQAMRDLLRLAVAAGVRPSYTRRLLSPFGGQPPVAVSTSGSASPLLEPLTARELEVLRLIAAGLTNQEIADQLVVALSTVKRHIANAYGKLGAGHRTEAIVRATALDLL